MYAATQMIFTQVLNASNLDDIDKEYVFDRACYWGQYEVVGRLLPFIDTINVKWLQSACSTGNLEGWDDRFLKTIKLLLDSGKCVDVDNIHIEKEISSDFQEKTKMLLDEYRFRLDGPRYNENIIG
uniref:Ankyrin repeat protein n=1 Tax=viral metagenome TaxID=1070528 RepID=A0A6C0JRJ2_9ZZZZ